MRLKETSGKRKRGKENSEPKVERRNDKKENKN